MVLVLIALASGVASLALRQSDESRLEREAVRLGALLESARAEARASGVAVRFSFTDPNDPNNTLGDPGDAFRFTGLLPEHSPPTRWLAPGTTGRIEGARALLLGPEPMIGAQRIVLRSGERELVLATDGLSPFDLLVPEGGGP